MKQIIIIILSTIIPLAITTQSNSCKKNILIKINNNKKPVLRVKTPTETTKIWDFEGKNFIPQDYQKAIAKLDEYTRSSISSNILKKTSLVITLLTSPPYCNIDHDGPELTV